MAVVDIQQQVYDLLSRASNVSFVSAEREAEPRVTYAPGQRVSAEVLSTMAQGNRTQVRIGSERYTLDLPMQVRQGQTLEMTFVSQDPRTTFAIARQAGTTPPVSLSDASRLLSLLVGNEQILDPRLRSSLQSIGDMLRRSSGEAGVLANLMDEVITYGSMPGQSVKGLAPLPDDFQQQEGGRGGARQQEPQSSTAEQTRLAAFELNASRILRHIASTSRFSLAEAASQPLVPLPLIPGEEVDALVTGTLPGGRILVQVAGSQLELPISRAVMAGDILRMTYIASRPRPLFALPRLAESAPSELSQAGRWLSVLEHGQGGLSEQQTAVLDRLGTVLRSLPPGSPAFSAIRDEALVYDSIAGARSPEQSAAPALAAMSQPAVPAAGNGIILNDDMARLLQALISGNRLALLEAVGQQVAGGLMPGQQLKGEVLSALGGGRFMVLVAGQTLELSLPRGMARGDVLNLFFITVEPHPTFLLTRSAGGSAARVSETGRWLSGFLGETAGLVPAAETLGLLRTLLAEPPRDAAEVGMMLQQGLRGSGLFYESHLSRWFGGDYPLEDILKEPQGLLSSRLQLPEQGAGDDAAPASPARIRQGLMEAPEAVIEREALPLVREQLAALENGRLLYRGELFPGQKMEWSVAERDAGRGARGSRERSWESGFTLCLPRLGEITARLSLDTGGFRIALGACEPQTVTLLEQGRQRLLEQLDAAGLAAARLEVSHASP